MKAISIRQPWAWLIVRPDIIDPVARAEAVRMDVIKPIENRSWATRFRGHVLVHASKGMTRAEYEDAMRFALAAGVRYDVLPRADQLERGGIVGETTIDACMRSHERRSRWHMEGCFGFHMVDTRPMPFIPCKGALQFFEVPADVAEQARAAEGDCRG
jgi:hypothetical protein